MPPFRARRIVPAAFLPGAPLLALSLAGAAGFAATAAHAASSTPLEVSSTVIPAACTAHLSNGGLADYGVMAASVLRPGQLTPLPPKTFTFSINCDVAARFSVRLVDNRPGSLVPGIIAAGSGDGALGDDRNFGLGTSAARRVGGYAIRFLPASFSGDYQAVHMLESSDGSTWRSAGGLASKHRQLAWGADSGSGVLAYQALSGQLVVQPYLNRPENLSLRDEVVLDGAATLELLYL